jgi:hypothetical protein
LSRIRAIFYRACNRIGSVPLATLTTARHAIRWTQWFPARYNDCNMTVVQTKAATSARARTEGFAPFFVSPGECERPNCVREDV